MNETNKFYLTKHTVTGIDANVCNRRIAEWNSLSVLIALVSKSDRGK